MKMYVSLGSFFYISCLFYKAMRLL